MTTVVISTIFLGALPADADSIRSHQWMLTSLRIPIAEHYSTGKSVIVAVIDTGVDGTHPDLVGSVLQGADLSDPDRPDGIGNGWNDQDGHGTTIASLIAGHGHGPDHSNGILGLAPDARILPVRNGVGGFLEGNVATGIRWAISHGASVICLAQGSPTDKLDLSNAIADAEAQDVVVVAAAGNIPEQVPEYPAAYPGVLAVGGVGKDGKHAAVSVEGSYISIAAPAVDIYSAYLHHGYATGTGTSAATAIVAGAAALVRARFPHLSAAEVIHRLTATATDEGPPGRDDEYGYGDLNIVAALTADVPPLSATSSSPSTSAASPLSSPESLGGTASIAPSVEPSALAEPASDGFPLLPVGLAVLGVLVVVGIWNGRRRASR